MTRGNSPQWPFENGPTVVRWVSILGVTTISVLAGTDFGDIGLVPDLSFHQESAFWFYGAGAQTVGTLFAFLLAGYVFFNRGLRRREEEDPTLEDVHDVIRDRLYTDFRIVSIFSGVAVVLALFSVATVKRSSQIPDAGFLVSGASVLLAVVLIVLFVIEIADPDKVSKAAEQIRDDISPGEGSQKNAEEFFQIYRNMDQFLRDAVKDIHAEGGRPDYSAPEPPPTESMREIIDFLYRREVIDHASFEDLTEIRRLRNALFHGEKKEISDSSLARLKDVWERVQDQVTAYMDSRTG